MGWAKILFFVIICPIVPFIGTIMYYRVKNHFGSKIVEKSGVFPGDLIKSHTVLWVCTLLSIAILVFEIIYFLFYFRIGLPASQMQADDALMLTASDWLSFFGSYLGCVGSLVMAYLVYRQSKKIDELTLADYAPAVFLEIRASQKTTDVENFKPQSLFRMSPEDPNKIVYTIFCKSVVEIETKESFGILLFVDIVNVGKTALQIIAFNELLFRKMKKPDEVIKYTIDQDMNLANGKIVIRPNHGMRLCCYLEAVPASVDTSWVQLTAKANNKSIVFENLVYKKPGEAFLPVDALLSHEIVWN